MILFPLFLAGLFWAGFVAGLWLGLWLECDDVDGELFEWIVGILEFTDNMDVLGVFHASTNFATQESTYHCWGCRGESRGGECFFPHDPDCKYLALMGRIRRKEDG